VRLQGSLDAFSLPDIFQLLTYTKKTGALHIRRAVAGREQHGVVYVVDGAVSGAVADTRRQVLARRVVGSGLVHDQALRDAVASVAAAPGRGVTGALLAAGEIEDAAVRELVEAQVIDAVFDLLRWPDGDFAFVVDETNPDEVGLRLVLEQVVDRGRQRMEHWGALTALIPSPDSVLSLALSVSADATVTRSEWALLALIDGQRPVGMLAALSGQGDYDVMSALATLVERGLIAVPGTESHVDTVGALVARQQLLASLETPAQPVPSAASPEPAVLAAAQPPAPPAPREDAAAMAAVAPLAQSPVADGPSPVPAYAGLNAPADPAVGPSAVVPRRPEPFATARRPAYPDLPPGLPVEGSAAIDPAAVAPEPRPVIEHDASINKSLLLRLIAGVRGL